MSFLKPSTSKLNRQSIDDLSYLLLDKTPPIGLDQTTSDTSTPSSSGWQMCRIFTSN